MRRSRFRVLIAIATAALVYLMFKDRVPDIPSGDFGFIDVAKKFQDPKPVRSSLARRFSNSATYRKFGVTRLNNASLCGPSETVLLLIQVHSRPAEPHRRHGIRATWGNRQRLHGVHTRLVFMLGLPEPSPHRNTIQKNIEDEAKTYGDIVQHSFVDSLRNKTLKSVLALKWASDYCPGADFILKTVDRMFVNVNALQSAVADAVSKREDTKQLHIGPLVVGGSPIRELEELPIHPEYVLSYDDFPDKTFPPYVGSRCNVMTQYVAKLLYETSKSEPIIPGADDVYFGFLNSRYELGIAYIDMPHCTAMVVKDICKLRKMAGALIDGDPDLKAYLRTWNDFHDLTKCIL